MWLLITILLALVSAVSGYGVYGVAQHQPSVCPNNASDFGGSVHLLIFGYINECAWLSRTANSYSKPSQITINDTTGSFETSFQYYYQQGAASVCESTLLLNVNNLSSNTLYQCGIALNSEAFSVSVAPDILTGIAKYVEAGLAPIPENAVAVGIYADELCQEAPRVVLIQYPTINCTGQSGTCRITSNGYYSKSDCFSEIIVNVTTDPQASGAMSHSTICGHSGVFYMVCLWMLYLFGGVSE